MEHEMFPGVWRAQVVRTDDPEGRGRVQLIVPALNGSDPFDWAMPCLPVSSTPTLPAVGDVVWAMFEQGDPDHPVWLGTWALAPYTESVGRSLELQWNTEAATVPPELSIPIPSNYVVISASKTTTSGAWEPLRYSDAGGIFTDGGLVRVFENVDGTLWVQIDPDGPLADADWNMVEVFWFGSYGAGIWGQSIGVQGLSSNILHTLRPNIPGPGAGNTALQDDRMTSLGSTSVLVYNEDTRGAAPLSILLLVTVIAAGRYPT